MAAGKHQRNDPRRFPLRFAGSRDSRDADAWAQLQLIAAGGCDVTRMRLIRWQGLRSHLGDRWADSEGEFVAALRGDIDKLLPPGGCCVRYDDVSFLVLCPDGSAPFLRDPEAEIIGKIIGDALGDAVTPVADLIEVWTPVATGDDGFDFRRAAAAAPAGADAAGAPAEAPDLSSKVVLTDAEFLFLPIWDVGGNEVFGYLCQPFWNVGDGELRPESSLAAVFSSVDRVGAVDVATLTKAAEVIQRVLDGYGATRVVVPVHHDVLADEKGAPAYFEVLERVIWPALEYVYFEIVGTPPDSSRERIAAIAQRLSPFACGVLLRVAPGFDRFDSVPRDDLLSVGCEFAPDSDDDAGVFADLERFARRAKVHNLRSHVIGLTATGPTVAAVNAGFDYVGSEIIAPALKDDGSGDLAVEPVDILKSILAAKSAERK